jgi:hypothetical protein
MGYQRCNSRLTCGLASNGDAVYDRRVTERQQNSINVVLNEALEGQNDYGESLCHLMAMSLRFLSVYLRYRY